MVDEPQAEFGSLVVVGASAGGIEALTKLLGSLSPSFPAPIVVAQHTNPLRESHLGEILQSRTRLPVVTLADRQALRGGTVYLVPHDHHILITDHTVEPREAKGDHPSPSVDRLLTSAADVFGERLIAVILSGMGQDGVLGAGDVKAHGGTVIIQNPETAAQPSMPRALPPTLVDFVANAERMGELLLELATTPPGPVDDEERLLAQFLDRIRERTGIDFSAYKRPTVRRRLQRRMVATANPRLRDYIRFVQRHPEEYQRLSVVTRPLEIQNDEGGSTTHVRLTLQPYGPVGGDGPNSVLVTIVDVSDVVLDRRELEVELGRSREDQQNLARRLEGMGRSHRELMQANEEMTNANAGLRIANEELLVANEEVQAATEEVETLNEELQATNEELETLNEELQATVEELNTTNDDLEARSTELTETAASLVEQRHRSEVERQRLALILDGMTDAVMVVDRAGEVVATNRAFEEQFRGGLPIPQDASGANLPEDQWPQARAACGESFSMSFTRADSARGERRWYEATGHAGPGEGGAVIVIRDITDRSLRRVQEHFIDAASHELQTPLAALHNYLQLMQRALGKGSGGDEADRYLSRAIEQSRVLADLASRLFDVSLIRHGRIVVARKRTSLRDVLLAAVDEVRMASPEAALQVRSGRARGVVLGDALRLRQMLTNLLRNAVTHGASEHPVEVSMALRGGRVEVVVADRGPGLPASVHAHLFSPFVSGEGGTGLGLGLYLARAIAVEHGGGLEIEPRAGGGTEARVQLPLADGGAR